MATVNSLAVSVHFATSAVSFEPLMSALLQCNARNGQCQPTCGGPVVTHTTYAPQCASCTCYSDGPHSVQWTICSTTDCTDRRSSNYAAAIFDICHTSSVTVESKCSGFGFYAVESIVGTLQRMTLIVARVLTAVPNCCCRLRLHEPARRMRPRSSRCRSRRQYAMRTA